MKVSISREELANLIGKIQAVVPSKPTIPILANILVEAYDDQLIISSTDLTVSMRAFAPARIEEEGAITLPARRFFQLVRELTVPQVEIECTTGEIAYITAGTSRFKLNGMHKSEFPSLPDFAGASDFSVPATILKELMTRSAFAAAREDSRHVLNGISLAVGASEALAIGTDGKRLAKIRTKIEGATSEPSSYLVPLKAVEEMVKMSDGKELCKLSLLPDKVALESDSTILVTKLLSGQFPDVERVVPKDPPITVSLHREELMTLLRQVALFTSDRGHSVHFIFGPGELHLEAASNEIGEGRVSMPVDYSGEPIQIAYNPNYFLDILRHCKDETVKFGITDAYNPGLITDSTNATFVIMPMRLNG